MNTFLGLMLDPSVDGRGSAGGQAMGFAAEQDAALPPDVALAYVEALKAPAYKAPTFEHRWTAWGAAYGGYNKTNGDPVAGASNVTARAGGFAAGMDYRLTPDAVAGFALAGGGTSWGLAQELGGGKSDALQVGVYGKTRSGPAYLAASLAFTNHWMSIDRFAFAGDHLTASFNARSYGGRVEAGYHLAATPMVAVTPYAAIQTQSFHTPSYSETDLSAGGFGLSYNARNTTDTRGELGASLSHLDELHNGMLLMLRACAAWAHDWANDPALSATFQALPGASFMVNGAAPAQNSVLASAGAELRVTPALALAAKFDGELAHNAQSYSGTGTLRYVW
jgi:outer membrane autotransporter protein